MITVVQMSKRDMARGRIKNVASFVVCLFVGACSIVETGNELTKQDARDLAERFVVANGYTDLPATADPDSVFTEFYDCLVYGCDEDGTVEKFDELLEARSRSLSATASGYRRLKDIDSDGFEWSIYFKVLSLPGDEEGVIERFRCVDIDVSGRAWLNEAYCRDGTFKVFPDS